MAQQCACCGFTWGAGSIGDAADRSIDVAADMELDTGLVEAESELADLQCGCRIAIMQ